MRFFVFGSLNIDRVYTVSSLPEKGETVRSSRCEVHVGGKGLNQAVALSAAGAGVFFAGAVGTDGQFLTRFLQQSGVSTQLIEQTDGYSGQAVIEVDAAGQNQMIIFPGANRTIQPSYCERLLEHMQAGDILLMQYETSCVEYMSQKAHEKGVKVALNPSAFCPELLSFPYETVDLLILNEDEGRAISGESVPEAMVKSLQRLTGGEILLTLGADGSVYFDGTEYIMADAFKAEAVDTTGAGDTYTGYFLSRWANGCDIRAAMRLSSAAAALCVTRRGAAETIPQCDEVAQFLRVERKEKDAQHRTE